VRELKEVCAEKSQIIADEQRLIYKGILTIHIANVLY
jgi:hypothetical protein